jgi:hypothetical protein
LFPCCFFIYCVNIFTTYSLDFFHQNGFFAFALKRKTFFLISDLEDEFVQQGGASWRSNEKRLYKMSLRLMSDKKTKISEIFPKMSENLFPLIFNEISGEVKISPAGWIALKRHLESSSGKKMINKRKT